MKHMLVIGIATFLFFNSFGMTHLGMSVDTGGQMSDCPFMGVPALCHMNPIDHIFALQNMLVGTPVASMIAFLASLLLVFAAVPLLRRMWHIAHTLLEASSPPQTLVHQHLPRHSLQEAFASGIIHSKAF